MANLAYSALCFAIALGTFHWRHGLGSILGNGIFLGGLYILVVYYATGRMFYLRFREPAASGTGAVT
jgi:hypothetical protein